MSSVFFCLTVGLLLPLFVKSYNPPPLPHSGKLSKAILNNYYIIQEFNYMEDTIICPNNSMIPAEYFHHDDRNNDGLNDGLWCQSAMVLS